MTFKVGEKVKLKHVTEADKNVKYLTYLDGFENNEGLTATILTERSNQGHHDILIDSNPQQQFFYHENWLEKLVTYDAF